MKASITFSIAKVFYNVDIAGNMTGIVRSDRWLMEDDYMLLSKRLQFPDTAFIVERENIINHRTFSPFEELSFCTQTLLASAAFKYQDTGSSIVCFDTALGKVRVIKDKVKPHLWWVETSEEQYVKDFEYSRYVINYLSLDPKSILNKIALTGLGRKRIYIPISTVEELYNLSFSSELIIKLCEKCGLNGICFFTKLNNRHVAIRVFTTSLNGKEDAATGGAALGLIACNKFYDLELDEKVRIDQGHKKSSNRGSIFIWNDTKEKINRIGGLVDLISINGQLLCQEDL
ncbi:PhzF family phenazine biosynthesis protein [Priestia megaterium]|uniref:PhzF family phenazine biosynthesis protein n=1 Tax=Priestia megaterium TaxID=1404 RepID=UPI0011A06DB6|nr:PhzF family phenazine biosynthesis protein [Priestia megaterium]